MGWAEEERLRDLKVWMGRRMLSEAAEWKTVKQSGAERLSQQRLNGSTDGFDGWMGGPEEARALCVTMRRTNALTRGI